MGATVGRRDGDEGASEGPMSFAVAPGGDVVVLDQVNARLARFDSAGVLVHETPIGVDTFQELELLPNGEVLLLDRLVRSSLLRLDAQGYVVREDPLVGGAIRAGGLVTAMLTEPDGVWLEVGHRDRVQVLDAALSPGPRHVLPGRRYSAAKHLMAALDGTGGAALWLEDAVTGAQVQRAVVQPARRIDRIIWVETDQSGDVHAMFHLLEWDPVDVTQVVHEAVLGVRFDASLQQVASYTSPHVIQIWEQFREFRVMPDGTIYQMAFDGAGMSIFRWRWV
jgi:hypothetical protein